MHFKTPLIPATLIQRYKRFLADVTLDDGRVVTVHVANPGAMLGLKEPGSKVWLQAAANPKAKLPYSLELVEAALPCGTQKVGINTLHPNRLAEEAIGDGRITELSGYAGLRREVRYGANSRVDLLLTSAGRPDCYVEVKNVHLMREAGLAEFPDCVTARGAKHLAELSAMVAAGHRAVMLFVIQMQAERFRLAADIDPAYAAAFQRAVASGVEALAYVCRIDTDGIHVQRRIPVEHSL